MAPREMPRSIVIGNGSVLVGFDASYSVRDLYYPRIGDANQTMGNLCRTGFFVDGRFAWVSDPGWERDLGYEEGTLVTKVALRHPDLGLTVLFSDYVDMARNYFVRKLRVSARDGFKVARVFFHYDWWIDGSDLGNTVFYDPKHRAVCAYKDNRYFLLGGYRGPQLGPTTWACGKKGGEFAGTWVDAEDGELGRNPIDQGSVDCTLGFELAAAGADEARELTHWVCMGESWEEVAHFGQELLLSRGEETYRTRTTTYWSVWCDKDHRHIEDELGRPARDLFRRSVLTARTHVDNGGGIIAATDYDITKFARDTYDYVWPRDGALVANALDRAGHEDVTRQFFTFCRSVLPPEGYFLHKYTPAGWIGSSWHPWMNAAGERVLPIQEDETGLVLWALWQHYQRHRNLDFVVDLYTSLVLPAADWMAAYTDEATGLPLPSWDLWEERHGVHAFTIGAVHGGLEAAYNFSRLFGDASAGERYTAALARLRQAADEHLYRPELGRFARRLMANGSGGFDYDPVLDSALSGLWRFGMYPPDDPRIRTTMEAIGRELGNKAACGGIARYANDYYFQVERDVALVPGNPWFICTLWQAQWHIATARSLDDLRPARDIIDWTVARQLPAGLLSEQVDPHTGAPLSVAPLTWSHAEFVITVEEYVRRAAELREPGARRVPRSGARAAAS